jgi:hypothetical protein
MAREAVVKSLLIYALNPHFPRSSQWPANSPALSGRWSPADLPLEAVWMKTGLVLA